MSTSRHDVLQRLSAAESCTVGVFAGVIEAATTQPLTYAKNCQQQQLKISFDPRVVYRGTVASCAADGTLIGVQFVTCGALQRLLVGDAPRDLSFGEEMTCALTAGFVSGFPCTVLELTMIQQQRHGGSASATLGRIVQARGAQGLFRGFLPAAGREAFFAAGYLGLSPRVQRVCDGAGLSDSVAKLAGSLTSGALCAAFTHPLDTVKSCIQGDLLGERYSTVAQTTQTVFRESGLGGFYRGYAARAAMVTCCFLIFEESKLRLSYLLFPGKLA